MSFDSEGEWRVPVKRSRHFFKDMEENCGRFGAGQKPQGGEVTLGKMEEKKAAAAGAAAV
jgi:hypothetical protein